MRVKINFKMWPLMLICITAFLFSCDVEKRMHNNALKYFSTHPDTAAAYCGKQYPPRDSITPVVIDSSKKANNRDYTPDINKLEDKANALLEKSTRDSLEAASISKECAKIVSDYKVQLINLIYQIKELKEQYKVCQSDSIFTSQKIYRENVARVIDLGNTITFIKNAYDKKISELATEKEKNAKLRKTNLILISIIVISFVLLIVRAYFKLKSKWLK